MRYYLSLLTLLVSFCASSQSFNTEWAFNLVDSIPYGGDVRSDKIVVDPVTNDIYVAGDFESIDDFDPGPGVFNLTSAGGSDAFLTKLDQNGNLVWAISIGGTDGETVGDLRLDNSGNVVITGRFGATVDFDPGVGTNSLTASGTYDTYVAKYNASGALLWAKQMGGTGSTVSYGMAIDASDNIIVTGSFENADFDPNAGTANLTSFGGNDGFVAKYDMNGNYSWAFQLGSTSTESAGALTVDGTGAIFVTGTFSSAAVDFDPGPGTASLASVGSSDIFFGKYDAAGNYIWAKSIGGSSVDLVGGISLDMSGNIALLGTFLGALDADPGIPAVTLTSAGGFDVYMAKYDGSGNYIWSNRMGGSSNDFALGLTKDASDNLYATGYFRNTVDFDPGVGTANLTAAGGNDIFIAKYATNGAYLWANRFGAGSNDVGSGVAVDNSDNLLITGEFQSTVDFDPSAGNAELIAPGFIINTYVGKYTSTGAFIWTAQFGLWNNLFYAAEGTSVTHDAAGNVYSTGFFRSTIDADPSAAVVNISSASSNQNDAYIAKYDGSGNYVWAFSIGSTTNDIGTDIRIDANGDLVVIGNFSGTVDFDPGVGVANLTSSGNDDIFLAKYSAAGNYIWAVKIGGTSVDYGKAIEIDASNNIVVTGHFYSVADFDPSAATANLGSFGSADAFLAKYDQNGNYLWANKLGGASLDFGRNLALDNVGNIHLVGYFASTSSDFNPGAGTANLSSLGNYDIFLAKYDANGAYIWANAMGGTGNQYGRDLVIDNVGNITMTGDFAATCDFDPSAGTASLTAVGSSEMYLAQYDASGNYLFAVGTEGAGSSSVLAQSITYDGISGLLVTGLYSDVIDFDPSAGVDSQTSMGLFDVFLAKYDLSANHIWTKSMGGSSADRGYDVDITNTGEIFVSGSMSGTADFDPSATILSATSLNSTDIFLAKYSECLPNSGTDVISGCDSLTWIDGNTYTASNNTATFVLTNAAGCDSTVTLNLTINNSTAGSESLTACDNYTWAANGTNYTMSGTYTATLTNAAGCDSTATLNLTINTSTAGSESVTACDNYTWAANGTNYTMSGTYTDTLTNAAGCDSTATLNLTINNSTSGSESVTACDNYTWAANGTNYTMSGTYTATLTNAAGCDSTATLNLTINNSTSGSESVTACDNYTWAANGTNYTMSGTYTATLTNAAGCDSTATLNLTINNSTAGSESVTACDNYTWAANGTNYTMSGTYTATLTNAAGCDSTATLNLTINNSTAGSESVTACDNYTWAANGTNYTMSGTYTATLTNAAGCDSTATLNLTINTSTAGSESVTACDNYTWVANGTNYTMSGTYTATLTNAVGCDSTAALNLTINNSTSGSESVTACDNYTWAANGTNYTMSGTYTATLTNAEGCDSTATLNLTINNSTSGSESVTACDNYTWAANGTNYTMSGTYTATLTNAAGCDSIVTLNLTINSVTDVTTTTNGVTLTANNSAASYQWLDCDDNNAIIINENGQNFTVQVNGNYAVELTENGCIDTSACVAITTVGIQDIEASFLMKAYPNPTSNQVTVDFGGAVISAQLEVTDSQGRRVKTYDLDSVSSFEVVLGEEVGVYFITVQSDMYRNTVRIVKK